MAWAKAGLWDSDRAEAYEHSHSEEIHIVQDNEEKPLVEAKEEISLENLWITRTRPEMCDQEVKTRSNFGAAFLL